MTTFCIETREIWITVLELLDIYVDMFRRILYRFAFLQNPAKWAFPTRRAPLCRVPKARRVQGSLFLQISPRENAKLLVEPKLSCAKACSEPHLRSFPPKTAIVPAYHRFLCARSNFGVHLLEPLTDTRKRENRVPIARKRGSCGDSDLPPWLRIICKILKRFQQLFLFGRGVTSKHSAALLARRMRGRGEDVSLPEQYAFAAWTHREKRGFKYL